MAPFFRKRPPGSPSPHLIAEVAPRAANAKQWVKACRAEITPRAQLEGGIAELCVVGSVVTEVAGEELRGALLLELADEFLAEFAALAAEHGWSREELARVIAERREAYRKALDGGAPDWHLRLAAEIYRRVARREGGAEEHRPAASLALVVSTTTRQLLREALKSPRTG
jgi:hypothetical protein